MYVNNIVSTVAFIAVTILSTVHATTDKTSDQEFLKNTAVPKCQHVDPYFDVISWSKVNSNVSNCDPLTPKDINEIASEAEKKRYKWGSEKFAFDVLASDKIGPRRKLSPVYHQLCESLPRRISLKASVVIIYYNEALSVLIRMLNSIFDQTPPDLLKEIILYDDSSDYDTLLINHINIYGAHANWPMEKIIARRSDERLGLIKAKVYAARMARGDVLIFLDSHCEVTPLWIEPLLAPIEEDPKRVVLPVIDLIDPRTFEYSKAMVTNGTFDWNLHFIWKYIPWEYWDIPENNIIPFKSAVMSGGLLAINRNYFHDMGEYDLGMQIWGAENIEMSVRIWLCGGSVLVAPCSHVGHVFRTRRPYRSKPGTDSNLYNSLRTVKVWFDDFDKYFYEKQPKAKEMDAGDLSERFELKKKLNCKQFQWYLKEINPELQPKHTVHEDL